MLAKDIMTKGVAWVSPETTVEAAAKKMETLNVGVLPVCNGEKLVGMVTDRDIVLHSTAEGKCPSEVTISQVMSPKVEYCLEHEKIDAIRLKMEKSKIRRIPVISKDKKLVGIISLGDLANKGESRTACAVLEKVSQPA